MKIKSTLKAAVAAAVIASSFPAGAAISPGEFSQPAGVGELFLSVWDDVNRVSYVRDLGITFADWRAGVALSSQTFLADSLYLDLLNNTNLSGRNDTTPTNEATVGVPRGTFASTTGLYWNVVAVSAESQEILSTSKASRSQIEATQNFSLDGATGMSALHAGANNSLQVGGNVDYTVNTSNMATAADGDAYSGNEFTARDRFGSQVLWSNAALSVADEANRMSFYHLQGSYDFPQDNAIVSENAGAYWSFDGTTGTLVYAVPEADTWALFGAGLVMLGAVARRKRSA